MTAAGSDGQQPAPVAGGERKWASMNATPDEIGNEALVSLVASAMSSGLGLATDREALRRLSTSDPTASLGDLLRPFAQDFVDMRGDLTSALLS